MFYSLQAMGYGPWAMGCGLRAKGLWAMGYGLWAMRYRLWSSAYGLRTTSHGVWATWYRVHFMCYGLCMRLSHPHRWKAHKTSWFDDWRKISQANDRDDNQSCHNLTVLFNQIESVLFMYSDIEASFNSLLKHATSTNIYLKLSLFALIIAFCFARFAFKKANSCSALARVCSCSSRNKVYSKSIFLEKVWTSFK